MIIILTWNREIIVLNVENNSPTDDDMLNFDSLEAKMEWESHEMTKHADN
jgi:hypothetical protein